MQRRRTETWSNVFRYCRWSLRWRRHTTVGHVRLLATMKSMEFDAERINTAVGLAIYVHRYAHQLNWVLLHHTCQAIPGKPGTYMSFCNHFIFSYIFVYSISQNRPVVLHCLFIVSTSDIQGLSVSRLRAGRHKHLCSQTVDCCWFVRYSKDPH